MLLATAWACDSAFAPRHSASDGDSPDGDLDAETDAEEREIDSSDADTEPVRHLIILPQFAYRGRTVSNASVEFDNTEELREILTHDNSCTRFYGALDFGDKIYFDTFEFDQDELKFKNIKALVDGGAKTGSRTVSARVTCGRVHVTEYGRFAVLDP